jgi:hypothetical protein
VLFGVIVGAVVVLSATERSAMAESGVLPVPATGWRLVTDGVMGGVSEGQLRPAQIDGRDCLRLTGAVRTENNGGFVQMALDLPADTRAAVGGFDGIRLSVYGNNEDYNVHLRTSDLWLPWQSYRATFRAVAGWHVVELPFAGFAPHRTRTGLRLERLQRLGIVAIGRAFEADLCVADMQFYRTGG